MNKVALQPTGSTAAWEHYQNTVLKRVPTAVVSEFVTPMVAAELNAIYHGKPFPIWGVTAGETGSNVRKWERLEPGDFAIFCGKGKLFSYGEVTMKLHDSGLARQLWGDDENGKTWEYVYFLRNVKQLDVPYAALNTAAGYATSYIVQGFTVLHPDKSAAVIAALDLGANITVEDFHRAIQELDLEIKLDARRLALQRTEQGFIRGKLLGGKTEAQCAICGKSFPVNLLACAHIKPRAHCTDQEKRAINRNVVPMCKFGCDDLFEKRYITVVGGRVRIADDIPTTAIVDRYLAAIKDLKSPYWNEERAPYFLWHSRRTFGRIV